MGKISVKYITLFLVVSLLLACVAGCKDNKDVYGAASDFIKVSHPDKPNTNVFSDENYDGNESSGKSSGSSDKNSSSEAESGNVSDGGDTASDSSETKSGNDSENKNQDGAKDSSSVGNDVLGVLPPDAFDGSGTNIKDTPAPGDHSPAIQIP